MNMKTNEINAFERFYSDWSDDRPKRILALWNKQQVKSEEELVIQDSNLWMTEEELVIQDWMTEELVKRKNWRDIDDVWEQSMVE